MYIRNAIISNEGYAFFQKIKQVFWKTFEMNINDPPPNPLLDSTVSPKVKTSEEGVMARFLTHNTSKVRGPCWSSKMGTRTINKQINYLHGPT
jgi:hypothetical protein